MSRSEIKQNTFISNEKIGNNQLIYPLKLTLCDSNTIAQNTIESSGLSLVQPVVELTNSNRNDIFENKIKTDYAAEIKLLYSSNNNLNKNEFVGSSEDHKIWLLNSQNNFLDNNETARLIIDQGSNYNEVNTNTADVIQVISSSSNRIIDNIINAEGGLFSKNSRFGIEIDGKNKTAENNLLSGNKIRNHSVGIRIIKANKNSAFGNQITNNDNIGIYLELSLYNVLERNYVKGKEIGVKVNKVSDNTFIANNRIYDHNGPSGTGIYVESSADCKVYGNSLVNNGTGIRTINSKPVTISMNNIMDSNFKNTGISLDNSDGAISGNNILNNSGNGIELQNGSEPTITNNNIHGNSGSGISNNSNDVIINADNNYWGSPDGPGINDISGNVDVLNWFSEPIELVVAVEIDTVFSTAGIIDSNSVIFHHLGSYDVEQIIIDLTDESGWLLEPVEIDTLLGDSTGIVITPKFKVPFDLAVGVTNRIFICGTIKGDSAITVSDTFHVSVYEQQLAAIKMFPDSATILKNDSLQIEMQYLDQFGNSIETDPVISVSNGIISENNIFHPGESIGITTIYARDSASDISDSIDVYVCDSEPVLTNIILKPDTVEVLPGGSVVFTARGYNQFNFPLEFEESWSATGGSIDFTGFFTADSTPGNFLVTVTDTISGITGEALVKITSTTGANYVYQIPARYMLTQNYPNPFNPETQIDFAIPYASNVKLEVFNIIGERVARLIDMNMDAGYKKYVWNPGKLASGVYFVRFIAEPLQSVIKRFVETKKMIYLK